MHRGACLCGAVSFEVSGTLPGPDACHCSDCRKFSGHFFVSTDVPRAAVTVHGDEHVRWYSADERVRRGFCATCGASLFWDPIGLDWMGIAMGAFEAPTDTKLHIHVWVADKGDYTFTAVGTTIWAATDAYETAEKHNQRMGATSMAPSTTAVTLLAAALLALSALPAPATPVLEAAVVEQRWSVYPGPVQDTANLDGYLRRPYADGEVVAPLLSIGLPIVAGLSTFYVSDLNQKIGLLYLGSAMAGSGYFYIDEPVKGTLYSLGGPIALTAGSTLGIFLGGGFSRCSECYMPNPLPLMSAVLFGYAAMAAYLGWVGITVRDEARSKAHPEDYPPFARPPRVPPPLGNESRE